MAQNSSFNSPVQNAPYSPPASFSTFHPLGQDRTSPEGSSCGEADQNREGNAQQEEESNYRDEGIESEEGKNKDCDEKEPTDDPFQTSP